MRVRKNSHHFAGVGFRVAQRNVAVQMHFIVIADELKDGDVKATGERHAILGHAYSVILDVRTSETTGPRDVNSCQTDRKMTFCSIRSPSLYDDVTEAIAAVSRWCRPAHVDDENKLFIVGSFHKHPHEQNIPGAQNHLSLAVRMPVRRVLVQGHLCDEVALLSRQGEVYHTSEKKIEFQIRNFKCYKTHRYYCVPQHGL